MCTIGAKAGRFDHEYWGNDSMHQKPFTSIMIQLINYFDDQNSNLFNFTDKEKKYPNIMGTSVDTIHGTQREQKLRT